VRHLPYPPSRRSRELPNGIHPHKSPFYDTAQAFSWPGSPPPPCRKCPSLGCTLKASPSPPTMTLSAAPLADPEPVRPRTLLPFRHPRKTLSLTLLDPAFPHLPPLNLPGFPPPPPDGYALPRSLPPIQIPRTIPHSPGRTSQTSIEQRQSLTLARRFFLVLSSPPNPTARELPHGSPL